MESVSCSSVPLPSSKTPPTPKEFFPFLLQILGKAVNFKAHVFVLGSEITIPVIEKMGFNPATIHTLGDPKLGWRMDGGTGENGSYGFRSRVWYAFKGGRYKCKIPLTEKGPRGKWGLTEAGVEEARRLCGIPTRNLTALFLEERLKKTGGLSGSLWRLLQLAVSAKLPLSVKAGIIEDHIQNCMLHLIARDSLRERILSGRPIPDTLLATYAVRAGFNDIRDMGTNPVTREMFGARTERERAKGIVTTPISDSRVVWSKKDSDSAVIVDVAADPWANGATRNVDEWKDFQKYMANVEEVIRLKKPQAGTRYLGILRMKLSGFTTSEIATEEGISVVRAASMIAEARRCLKEARCEGSLLFA